MPKADVGFSLDTGEELIDALEAQHEDTEAEGEDPRRNDPSPFENLTLHDLMVRMRRKQIEDLLERLEDGTATHQEHAIIQRLLAESGYTVDREPTTDTAPTRGGNPAPTALPNFDDEDYSQ